MFHIIKECSNPSSIELCITKEKIKDIADKGGCRAIAINKTNYFPT